MIRASQGPGLWLGRGGYASPRPVRYRALSHANNMQPWGSGVKGIVGGGAPLVPVPAGGIRYPR